MKIKRAFHGAFLDPIFSVNFQFYDANAAAEPFRNAFRPFNDQDAFAVSQFFIQVQDLEFGFILEIENDEGQTIIEKCIHPYAAESLASFCRRYLGFYEKIEAA